LLVDYADEGTPSAGEREQVESALSSLERAFEYGNDGLLLTVGYSPSYFDRYDEELPDSVDLPEPEGLMPTDDPDLDTQDAIIHLASDHAEAVLAAEEALLGEKAEVNGVEMESDVGDVFETVDRRTGFIGDGMPAERQDVDGIPEGEPVPEDSPLYMGFKSGFKKNRASEDSVTIEEGPFAGGTTEHVSKILLHLDEWYGDENDREDRVGKMFCPFHAEKEKVEGAGHNLGDSSGMDECEEDVIQTAKEKEVVGHSQKMLSVREDDEPIILRRDFDSTDDDQSSLHFASLQQTISDFVDTREAMNGLEVSQKSTVGTWSDNGILQALETVNRGNYLLPPRPKRALPTPTGDA
jgi:hypothetical protein